MSLRIREHPPLGLNHEAETPSGRFYRWGKDEPRPENNPSSHSFSTTMPGGFDQESVTLPRKPGVDYSDLERLTTLRAVGAGGEIASETRLERAPRTSGDQFSIGPEAKGWIAHTEDNSSAAEIYIDRELSAWQGMSNARKLALLKAGWAVGDFGVDTDPSSALPSLTFNIDGNFPKKTIEAWFDAGPGMRIASVRWERISRSNVGAGSPNSSFGFYVGVAANDLGEGGENTADQHTAGEDSDPASVFTPTTPARWARMDWEYPLANDDAFNYASYVRRPVIIGDHGLALLGTSPELGVLAADVVANAISRWAPLLRYTTGPTGTIRPSVFVIPHLSFKDKTTTLAMIEGANRYELRDYAVWENRTFHYHEWGDRGRKWRTRVAPSQLTETGPTVERLRNGAIVQWQDVDRSTKTAGPIGSGCDIEDETLEDRDPENSANQRGIRRWGPPIDMGGVSVESEAIRVGALYLKRLKETDTSGQMQLVATVEDAHGIVRPASQVRAGDTIVPVDASDTRERRIIRTSYNADTLTNTVDLDAPPDGTPDLLAQLGVSIADLGL